jgi:hypothetical protein
LTPFGLFHTVTPRVEIKIFFCFMNTRLAGLNWNEKSLWLRPRKCLAYVFCFLLLSNIFIATSVHAASAAEQIATLKAQKNDAIFSVQHIVNQPVTRLKRTPGMNVSMFSPGWFHAGATMPDFDTVDIRKTQETPYEGLQYVTSDLNPGVAFLGHELEFNARTKYFYTDRSQPKKRLTEAEMLQINELYRTIGRCNRQLEELENPPPLVTKIHQWITAHKPATLAIVGALLVALFWVRRKRSEAEV